jgi:hypothetical protein
VAVIKQTLQVPINRVTGQVQSRYLKFPLTAFIRTYGNSGCARRFLRANGRTLART